MDHVELMALARQVEQTTVDPSDILLTDQVAVVTGGGGGIGQGVALGLAKFGADVAVLDVAPERCSATEAAIGRLGRRAAGIVCDVIDSDQIRAAIAQVHERFGRVDILINNAGGVRAGPFMTQPEASMRRHVDINLISMFVATQEAARLMIEAGRGGTIVNVSSIEGSRAAPMFAVYAACKAGMIDFTRTMAVELAEHAIRVNCISPDHTVTPWKPGQPDRAGRPRLVGGLLPGLGQGGSPRAGGAGGRVCQRRGVAVFEDVRLCDRCQCACRRRHVGVGRLAPAARGGLDLQPLTGSTGAASSGSPMSKS